MFPRLSVAGMHSIRSVPPKLTGLNPLVISAYQNYGIVKDLSEARFSTIQSSIATMASLVLQQSCYPRLQDAMASISLLRWQLTFTQSSVKLNLPTYRFQGRF